MLFKQLLFAKTHSSIFFFYLYLFHPPNVRSNFCPSDNSMKSSMCDTSVIIAPKGGYLSASKWPVTAPGHLRIFWRPTNDVDLVLPKECDPSNEGK